MFMFKNQQTVLAYVKHANLLWIIWFMKLKSKSSFGKFRCHTFLLSVQMACVLSELEVADIFFEYIVLMFNHGNFPFSWANLIH